MLGILNNFSKLNKKIQKKLKKKTKKKINKILKKKIISHVEELQSGILFSETLEKKLDYSRFLNLI